MHGMAIGEVAQRVGLAPSAIRYYESLGLLPAPARVGGKRRYDQNVLSWLALIGLAREAGFTMAEIRQLVGGFDRATAPSSRWHALATRKLVEIDAQVARVARMRQVLACALTCECVRLEDCGRFLEVPAPPSAGSPRSARTHRNADIARRR